jgi:hypothetical protein
MAVTGLHVMCWLFVDVTQFYLKKDLLFIELYSGLALQHSIDYMANMSVLGSRMGEVHHSPSLLGSTELPFSLDGKSNNHIISESLDLQLNLHRAKSRAQLKSQRPKLNHAQLNIHHHPSFFCAGHHDDL